jgi:acyl-CoA synthetase (AMP-forming)/AMP-acid ligase II
VNKLTLAHAKSCIHVKSMTYEGFLGTCGLIDPSAPVRSPSMTLTPPHPADTERERISVTNFASTMVTMMLSNPASSDADLSSMRLASCGGSPLPPAAVAAAQALLGCEFFVSYGMTECCGKIAMSLLPPEAASMEPKEQLALMCTSGR